MNSLNTSGVPTKFVLEFCIEVFDGYKTEKYLHGVLREFHFEKEFFKISIPKLIQIFKHELLEGRIDFIAYHGKSNNAFLTPGEIEIIRKEKEKKQKFLEEEARKKKEAEDIHNRKSLEENRQLQIKFSEFILLVNNFNDVVKNRSNLRNKARISQVLNIFSSKFEDGRKIASTLNQEEKKQAQLLLELTSFFQNRNELVGLLKKDQAHTYDSLFYFSEHSGRMKDGKIHYWRQFQGASAELTGIFFQLGLVEKYSRHNGLFRHWDS
jgi:hypothetical protein